MTIENLLEEIESILEEGKTVPFTSNLLVDAEAIKTAIEDIRLNMPEELMQARLFLCVCVKDTMKSILNMLKVDAPERM